MPLRPECEACGAPAECVAAQSTNLGKTVRWVFICAAEAQTWNDGGDWLAPIYLLVEEGR